MSAQKVPRGRPNCKIAVFEWLYKQLDTGKFKLEAGESLTRKRIALYGKGVADALRIDIGTGRKWTWQWSLQFRSPGDIKPAEVIRLRKQDPEAAKNIRNLEQHFRNLVQAKAKPVDQKQPVGEPTKPSSPSRTYSYQTFNRKIVETIQRHDERRRTRAIENQTKAIEKLQKTFDRSLTQSTSADSETE